MESKYQVLHCHTTFSDGTMSHRGVLDMCADYNIGTVAFTDHDILMPDKVTEELKILNHPVKFISGIEITATIVSETERDVVSLHVIGLFVDHNNKRLVEFCREVKEKRRERVGLMVGNFKKAGFHISEEEVMEESSEGVVGKPHLVRALLKKKKNHEVLEEIILRFKEAADRDPNLKKSYEETRGHSQWQQVFDLFLSDTPFVPNVYKPRSYKVTIDDAVRLIREAGGIAILAHPYLYGESLGIELIEQMTQEKRIDGIETVPSFGETFKPEFEKDLDAYRSIIAKYGLVAAGGGDFHLPEDFERVTGHKTEMEETKTFIPKILAKYPQYEDKIY